MKPILKRLSGERGSVSVWLAVGLPTIMMFFGLAVDASSQISTMQRAHDLAAQAARIGGQQINTTDIQQGRSNITLNNSQAVAAARTYLAGSDATSSSVQIRNGRIVVDVTLTYRTRFLGLIGINQIRVSGESDARIAPALEGQEYP